jgi:hypothetical protein
VTSLDLLSAPTRDVEAGLADDHTLGTPNPVFAPVE